MSKSNKGSKIVKIVPLDVAATMAQFADASIDVGSINPLQPQQIGELIGAQALSGTRLVAYCNKHLKGFPKDVKDCDVKAIKLGLQKHKIALDAAKGRDVTLVKIGEDRYITMAEWVKTHGRAAEEGDKLETWDCTGAACMVYSAKKLGKMKDHKGGLKSFIAPRRKAISTHVSNRWQWFVAMAIRMNAGMEVEAQLERGKEVSPDKRPVVPMTHRIAKVLFRALKDAEDGDFDETVSAETMQAAIDAFWSTLGIEAPELDAKGQPLVAVEKAS